MDIPQELRDRVHITDHGVVEQIDPDCGITHKAYVLAFVVKHEGAEHAKFFMSSPDTGDRPALYEWLLETGTYAVLAKAGLIP